MCAGSALDYFNMTEWTFAQQDPSEQLCRLHYFGMHHGETDFVITVHEYLSPPDPTMKFYAIADRQTNQKVLPYTPVGWGNTLLIALSECMKAIRRFPYQGD